MKEALKFTAYCIGLVLAAPWIFRGLDLYATWVWSK